MNNTLFGYPVIEVKSEPLEGEIKLGDWGVYKEPIYIFGSCPYCGSNDLPMIENGKVSCQNCGLLMGEIAPIKTEGQA